MVRATFVKGAKVKRWEQNLGNPVAALKKIGMLGVAESRNAFKAQKFGKTDWEPRAPINVYGIIADFHAGKKKPPERRFETRPALRDTGALMKSIAFKVVSSRTVEWGSALPYAGVLHTGGRIESKTINSTVVSGLYKWLKKGGRAHAKALGFLFARKFRDKKLKGEVEARPFVGITKGMREEIHDLMGIHIMETKT